MHGLQDIRMETHTHTHTSIAKIEGVYILSMSKAVLVSHPT